MSHRVSLALAALALLGIAARGSAAQREVRFPLRLDHQFVRNVLLEQVFTGAGESVRVWDDGRGCNRLDLSEPRVDSVGAGLRITTRGAAVAGVAVGGRCIGGLTWNGTIELIEAPWVDAGSVVHFRIVDSAIHGDNEKLGLSGQLWSWTKRFVHPRLEGVTVDLGQAIADLRAVLPLFTAVEARARIAEVLETLTVADAAVGNEGLRLDLAFQVDAAASPRPTAAEPPLSAAELERWQNAWLQWDAFLTFVVKSAAADMRGPALEELQAVLIDARYELTRALSEVSLSDDPVRPIFLRTWERLAPLFRQMSGELPAAGALHYLSFIAAADALRTFDETPELGIDVSADGLRRLARILAPDDAADPLVYDTEIDPKLRTLFDFGIPLQIPEPSPSLQSFLWPAPAWAGDGSLGDISARLRGWVPELDELDEYLPLVHTLLVRTFVDTLTKHTLAREFVELFRAMLLTTAWQESCWRQFVKQRGAVVPMTSSAASVGIMQVNERVWRGFYDLQALRQNAAYNTAAGAEILIQYLLRYAIGRGEHTKTGKVENLARATYCVYNGGPGHLRRYREAKTSKSLRAIDESFWKKFQKVRGGDEMAVETCYRPSGS